MQQAPETVPSSVTSDAETLAICDSPTERLVELVRDRGGEVLGSQRTIAKAIGTFHTHVNRVLHDLETAGRVTLMATGRGTRVRLTKVARNW